MMDIDESKESPTELNVVRPTQFSSSEKTQFLEQDEDRICVRYVGKAQNQHDVGISLTTYYHIAHSIAPGILLPVVVFHLSSAFTLCSRFYLFSLTCYGCLCLW